jgi:hypothetical protein
MVTAAAAAHLGLFRRQDKKDRDFGNDSQTVRKQNSRLFAGRFFDKVRWLWN